ncbi:hypothetical protein ACFWP0_12165 [Achromobacter sp. NPDC058515]|uniref:hypothetical protein n=1 Tax=Achromobacter sp. NPDC058515 TaxID=3346533 RepID=UPI0036681E17
MTSDEFDAVIEATIDKVKARFNQSEAEADRLVSRVIANLAAAGNPTPTVEQILEEVARILGVPYEPRSDDDYEPF